MEKTETAWAGKLVNPNVDIYKSLMLASDAFVSSNLKAQLYKTIFNLYYTPAKLFSWGKRVDDKCPRCLVGPATLVHMFFD